MIERQRKIFWGDEKWGHGVVSLSSEKAGRAWVDDNIRGIWLSVKRLTPPDKPFIAVVDSFLSPKDCSDLISYAENGRLVRSELSGGPMDLRTSYTAHVAEMPLVKNTILPRVCSLLGVKKEMVAHGGVTRYLPGQKFEKHMDSVVEFDRHNRHTTLLIYLNSLPNDEPGGATRFTKLDLAVKPKAGMALWWRNNLTDSVADQRTEHQGDLLEISTKYILQFWVWVHPGGKRENHQKDKETQNGEQASSIANVQAKEKERVAY